MCDIFYGWGGGILVPKKPIVLNRVNGKRKDTRQVWLHRLKWFSRIIVSSCLTSRGTFELQCVHGALINDPNVLLHMDTYLCHLLTCYRG